MLVKILLKSGRRCDEADNDHVDSVQTLSDFHMILFLACNPDFWGSAAEAKEVCAEETYPVVCSMQR